MAEPTQPPPPKHDPRTCNSCGYLRHPALAKQGRALRAHLAQHPLPTQAGAR